MQHRNWAGRRWRTPAAISIFGIIGLTVTALLLTACSSTPTANNPTNGTNGGVAQGGGGQNQGGGNANTVAINVSPTEPQGVNPTTPIVVKASNGTLTSVTVTNSVKNTKVNGSLSADKTTWTSSEELGYGATYAVDAIGANADGGVATEKKTTISTLRPAKVAYPNMIPAPASVASTGIGVGQPVVFQFDQPVANRAAVQAALTVTTTPSQPGSWYWIANNEVHYRAQSYWQANTKIHVVAKIYGLNFGNGVYGAEDRTVDFQVHDALIAKADGNTEQMQVFRNGNIINTIPISMGKDATPTHVGTHVISSKSASTVMDSCSYGVCPPNPAAYKATEKWAVRISNDGEFVHENPNTVGVQGHDNVSHGCINVNEANAIWFFNTMGAGDVVEVTNSGGQQLPVYDLYGDWSVPWAKWQAGNA